MAKDIEQEVLGSILIGDITYEIVKVINAPKGNNLVCAICRKAFKEVHLAYAISSEPNVAWALLILRACKAHTNELETRINKFLVFIEDDRSLSESEIQNYLRKAELPTHSGN